MNDMTKYYSAGTGYSMSNQAKIDSRIPNLVSSLRDNVPPGSRVLDLGCGDMYLKELCPEYEWVGVDINVKRGDIVNHDLASFPYPFPTNHFDAAVCSEVLEHVWSPPKVLSELNRVLRRKGTLVVTVPNMDNMDNLLSHHQVLLYNPDNEHSVEHIRQYNLQSIRHLVEKAGFGVLDCFGNSPYLSKWIQWARAELLKASPGKTQIEVDVVLGRMFPDVCPGIGIVAKSK